MALMAGPSGEEGLFWASVWDSPEQRGRFVEAVRDGLEGLPLGGSVEEVEALGMPAAVLRVGIAQGAQVRIEGGGAP